MNDIRIATVRLVCPQCRAGLAEDPEAERIVCTNSDCRAAYPIADGLSRLVAEDASIVEVDAWKAAVENANSRGEARLLDHG